MAYYRLTTQSFVNGDIQEAGQVIDWPAAAGAAGTNMVPATAAEWQAQRGATSQAVPTPPDLPWELTKNPPGYKRFNQGRG